MKTKDIVPKSRKNYYVDIAAFVPFCMLLFTGIIMLMYHAGTPKTETILSRNGHFWLNTHILFAIISMTIVTIHLCLHLNWFKKLFSADKKNKYWFRNLMLLILFLASSLTAIISVVMSEETPNANVALGIHNKLGLLLIAFFLLHLLSYFKWLINMTEKVILKNSKK